MIANYSEIIASIPEEDRILLGLLKNLTKHNGLTEFGDDFIPPKYLDPNYIAPNSGPGLFIANIVLLAITCAIVGLRYYARVFIAGGLGADDVAIGISTLIFIGSTVTYCFAVTHGGFGMHIFDLDRDHIQILLEITYAMPILYNAGVFFIKLSLLLFYRRLFGHNQLLQRLVKALILFQVLYTVGYCTGLVFICQPIDSWWSLTKRADHCPDFSKTMVIYVSLRSISVFTDVLVLCLPMKMLWDLKIPVRQKAGLAVVFGLGFMACVTSVLRLAYLPKLLLNVDVSWNVVPVALLDELEQSLGIVTASLPALTAIVAKLRGSIIVKKSKYQSTTSFELSKARDPEAAHRNNDGRDTPAPEFDFLSVAYDPDSINTVYTRAWTTNRPRPKKRNGLGRMMNGAGLTKPPAPTTSSDENLMGILADPHGISKTTTVEVFVDKRV